MWNAVNSFSESKVAIKVEYFNDSIVFKIKSHYNGKFECLESKVHDILNSDTLGSYIVPLKRIHHECSSSIRLGLTLTLTLTLIGYSFLMKMLLYIHHAYAAND